MYVLSLSPATRTCSEAKRQEKKIYICEIYGIIIESLAEILLPSAACKTWGKIQSPQGRGGVFARQNGVGGGKTETETAFQLPSFSQRE